MGITVEWLITKIVELGKIHRPDVEYSHEGLSETTLKIYKDLTAAINNELGMTEQVKIIPLPDEPHEVFLIDVERHINRRLGDYPGWSFGSIFVLHSHSPWLVIKREAK